jgi:hypothetical protein
MANVYINAEVQAITSTAYHSWMGGELYGTPAEIQKRDDNTYGVGIYLDVSSGTRMESLILTDGIIESCTIDYGATQTEIWSSKDECSIYHYESCLVYVKLSSDATWISVRPGAPLLDGGWPDNVYCNGIDYGANFIRWNIKPLPYVQWDNSAITISQKNPANQLTATWNPATIVNNYSNESVIYDISCYTKALGVGGPSYYTTTTNTSITFTPPAFGESVYIQIYAYGQNCPQGKWSQLAYFTPFAPSVTTPTITVSHSNNSFTVSWTQATGSYGGAGASVSYVLKYWDSQNGSSNAEPVDMGTSRSKTIARWVTPSNQDITYTFQVTSEYSGGNSEAKYSVTSKSITLKHPEISWSTKTTTVSQVNNQVKVSWGTATVSNSYTGAAVKYDVYCDGVLQKTVTTTSHTFTPPKYDVALNYQVLAYNGETNGWNDANTTTTIYSARVSTKPQISSISYLNGAFAVKWSAAVGEYGPSGSSMTYTVTYWDSVNNTNKTTSSTTALSQSINRWINPTKTTGDITYSFKVTATYASKTGASNASTKKLSAPTISWPNPTTTVSQVHDQVQVSWNAATVSDSYTGGAVKYKVYCNDIERYNDTGLTTTFTLKSSEYDKELSYYVYAYNDETNGSNTATSAIIYNIKITTDPKITEISYSNNSFTIKWSGATGEYGPDGSAVTYKVFYKDDQKQKDELSTVATSEKSATIKRWSNPRYNDMICTFYVRATYGTTSKNVQSNSTSSTYTLLAPSIVWPNTTLTVTPIGNQVQVSWNPASVNNNYESEPVWYSVTCSIKGVGMEDGQYYANDTKSTSITFEPPAYDRELFVQVNAWANYAGGKWSEGVYFTVSSAPSHYTIKCYINDSWQVCIVKYYDGTQWIECIPKYYDGSQWQDCSF